jgi:hypothetical protein
VFDVIFPGFQNRKFSIYLKAIRSKSHLMPYWDIIFNCIPRKWQSLLLRIVTPFVLNLNKFELIPRLLRMDHLSGVKTDNLWVGKNLKILFIFCLSPDRLVNVTRSSPINE